MRRLFNKGTALLISAFMCATIVNPSTINAQEQTDSQELVESVPSIVPSDVQQEQSSLNETSEGSDVELPSTSQEQEPVDVKAGIEASSTDVNKPVLESVVLKQNGVVLDNGALVVGGSTIEVEVSAYDADSEITSISVQLAHMYDQVQNNINVWNLSYKEGNIYSLSYEVPQEACDLIYIQSLTIIDSNNNTTSLEYSSNEYFVNVDAKDPEIHIGQITDISFERNQTEITQDEIMLQDHAIGISVTMNDCSSVGYLVLNFSGSGDSGYATFSAYLYRSYDEGSSDDTGIFTGYLTRSAWNINTDLSGEYVLDRIEASIPSIGQSKAVSFETMGDYGFTYICKDFTSPEILSIEMDQVGEVLETGDTIDFKIKASDSSGLLDKGNLWMVPVNDGQQHEGIEVLLTYDQKTDSFIGSYTIQDSDYATEYVLNVINIEDTYGNLSSLGNLDAQKYYFQVMHDGTTVYPTYDIDINFMTYDANGVQNVLSSKKITDARNRSTYDELGIDLSMDCPVPFEGVKFLGWSLDGEHILSGDDKVYVSSNFTYISLLPVFDKGLYFINASYVSNDLTLSYKSLFGAYDKRLSSEELVKRILSESSLKDMRTDGFVDWQISSGGGENSSVKYISVNAEYAQKVVVLVKTYLANDGRIKDDQKVEFVEAGATFEELQNKIYFSGAPSDLYPGLRFTGWKVHNPNEGEIPTTSDYTFIGAIAETENAYVQYVLDPAYKLNNISTYGTAGNLGGMAPDEFTYVQIAEKNTEVKVPTKFEGYQSFEVYMYGQGATGTIVLTGGESIYVGDSMSLYGYGIKEEATDPEEPTDPVDPEEPVDPEQPIVPNVPVELPEDDVKEIVDKIKSNTGNEPVVVPMGDATVVNKEVLEAIKGKDIDLVLDMGDYQWTINGKEVKATNLADINLEVNFDTKEIPESIVNSVAQGRPVKQLSLTYNGNFGFRGTMRFYMGKEFAGQYGNLYYYDSDGKMVFMNAGLIDSDGYVSVSFSHASEYVVVVNDKIMGETTSDSTTSSGNTNTSTSTNTPGQDTHEQIPTSTNNEKVKNEVSTSVKTNSSMFAISMIVSLVAFVGLVLIKRKNNQA